MSVVLPEMISCQLYVYGLFDELVTGMALRAGRQGDVVLDVGAHFGYFTLLFSRLVGKSGRIVSLDPTPSTFAVLQRNTAHLSNVTRLKVAASRHNGSLTDIGLRVDLFCPEYDQCFVAFAGAGGATEGSS